MRQPKFNVGDHIVRTGYEWDKSENITIDEIVSDGQPFCPQLWYIATTDRGKKVNGLVSVVDSCFHLLND